MIERKSGMEIRNPEILADKELAQFIQELEDYDVPDCFDDINYVPSIEELKSFTEEQLDYLRMTINEDESDSIYDGGERYERAHHRCMLVIPMIDEELKRRKESSDVMKEKCKLSDDVKKEIVRQYPESVKLIAKDFVNEYVEVDMYRLQDDWLGCFSKYYTVGVTADSKMDSEFHVMTDGLLDNEKEKVMISDISDIIIKLYRGEILRKFGTIVKVSEKAKDLFGFDYYILDCHDLGVSSNGKSIFHVQLVQIYESEYDFIQSNDCNAFFDYYESKIPVEVQYLFGAKREPLRGD